MDSYVFAERPGVAGAPLLVLLHGTGGDERQMLELGTTLLPGAHLVAPRGDVSEHGALRYFRRTGEGRYDMADLARATDKLAGFIAAQAAAVRPAFVAALGYSNGANVLAAVLFAQPALVDRAVLMHPLIPFVPPAQPGLLGRQVLITAGRRDPIAPVETTEALQRYLTANGAAARLSWHDGGHELRPSELAEARALLSA